jgi:ribosomal-protein-alanine N-acetyltransferase
MALHTPRLLLREFVENDAAEVNQYEADPAVARYATLEVRSLADSLEYIRALVADSQERNRRVFDFALIQREHGRLIGRCGMKLSEAEPNEAMLWYVLTRSVWGKGYAVEAARAVLAFGFEELRLHRIFVDIDPRNSASLRVAEKLGLRREGHFLETTWAKGEWTDRVVFALLDREYRARYVKAKARESRRG